MKGFIVGYFEEWAYDRETVIVGYYKSWNKAITVVKNLERDNIKKYKGLRKVYMVEIEVDKTYPSTLIHKDWIENFHHYLVHTNKKTNETTLKSNRGKTLAIDLGEE